MSLEKDFDKYRFYQCVIKPLEYKCDCEVVTNSEHKLIEVDSSKAQYSKLIFINKYIPNIPFIEKKIIQHKMLPKINKVNIQNNK
jgi:hypothetical protein